MYITEFLRRACWKNAFCASDECFSAGDENIENKCSIFIPTQQNFSRDCYSTHLHKRAVATFSYSPASTLHPQVIYAISFSAGLNGLQVDEAD